MPGKRRCAYAAVGIRTCYKVGGGSLSFLPSFFPHRTSSPWRWKRARVTHSSRHAANERIQYTISKSSSISSQTVLLMFSISDINSTIKIHFFFSFSFLRCKKSQIVPVLGGNDCAIPVIEYTPLNITVNRIHEYYPNIIRDICGYPSIDSINPKHRIASVTVCEQYAYQLGR